jgi:hypothetical protein
MSYFHVLIADAQSPTQFRCVGHDLTETSLLSAVVKPYRKGAALLVGSEIVPVHDLRGLKIIQTIDPAEEALAAASAKVDKEWRSGNDDPRSGVVFMPFLGFGIDEVAEAGTDVTHRYITGAPGQGSGFRLIGQLFNHPWIVGIGTAVAAAGLIAWLKWN